MGPVRVEGVKRPGGKARWTGSRVSQSHVSLRSAIFHVPSCRTKRSK